MKDRALRPFLAGREHWIVPGKLTDRRLWECPSCHLGRLHVSEDGVFWGETGDSLSTHQEDAWDPEWIDGRFACLLECDNCKGKISLVGTYEVEDERGFDPVQGEVGGYEKYCKPLFFSESPHLVSIPVGVSTRVRDQLLRSFQLYWSDPTACANCVRSAVEEILSDRGVKKTSGRIKRRGQRRFLSLHERIQLFGQ